MAGDRQDYEYEHVLYETVLYLYGDYGAKEGGKVCQVVLLFTTFILKLLDLYGFFFLKI